MGEMMYNDMLVHIIPTLCSGISHWELGIDHSGSIYTTEIGKSYKSGRGLLFCWLSWLKKVVEKNINNVN